MIGKCAAANGNDFRGNLKDLMVSGVFCQLEAKCCPVVNSFQGTVSMLDFQNGNPPRSDVR